MDWLKAIYEQFGTPYPRASLVVVIAVSASLGGALWLFAGRLVEKDHRKSTAPPSRVSGPASTSGDNSPANTGDGNTTQYGQPSAPEKKPAPPKKD